MLSEEIELMTSDLGKPFTNYYCINYVINFWSCFLCNKHHLYKQKITTIVYFVRIESRTKSNLTGNHVCVSLYYSKGHSPKVNNNKISTTWEQHLLHLHAARKTTTEKRVKDTKWGENRKEKVNGIFNGQIQGLLVRKLIERATN